MSQLGQEFLNWSEKYRVKNFAQFKGQEEAVNSLKAFIGKFPKGKKAILLHGPTGVGKTSLAYIIKNEFDLELLELNASDFRNKEQLEIRLKPALEQASLFKKGKVILVDEVDGLSTTDKGGLPELIELIQNTKFPIIITANNIWDAKFGTLRQKVNLIELKSLNYKELSIILQNISALEQANIENHILTSIAIRSDGDVRAAINDLQTLAINPGMINDYLSLDERDKEQDIFNALKIIFKNVFTKEVLALYDSVDMPLDKIFLWLEENIPYEYSGEELFRAYELLSLADVFRGRIRRERHWRFLIYQNALLSAGISTAKKNPKTGFTKYKKPSRILKIWMSNEQNKYKKSIISKYANEIHCSHRKAAAEFHIVKHHILKNPNVQKKLDLSEQEIAYLNKIR